MLTVSALSMPLRVEVSATAFNRSSVVWRKCIYGILVMRVSASLAQVNGSQRSFQPVYESCDRVGQLTERVLPGCCQMSCLSDVLPAVRSFLSREVSSGGEVFVEESEGTGADRRVAAAWKARRGGGAGGVRGARWRRSAAVMAWRQASDRSSACSSAMARSRCGGGTQNTGNASRSGCVTPVRSSPSMSMKRPCAATTS
jgi:hypothetical protein